MSTPAPLVPRIHEPPAGWPVSTFEQVTDALAGALVASWRRRESEAAPARQSAAQPLHDRADGDAAGDGRPA
jgi:hypothetical protein